jgi:uncharacterized membrane protein YtjA (UPF0391 family)
VVEYLKVFPTSAFFVSNSNRENPMLNAAILCLVIALIAGAMGLVGTEILAAHIAWILFVVFLILAVVSFIFGRSGRSLE